MEIELFRRLADICKSNVQRHVFVGFFICTVYSAGSTAVVFRPQSVSGGPFPTNALTIPDNSTPTGLRIDLPIEENSCDPTDSAVVCSNQALLNTLDGFNVNPRVMACFSDAINAATIPNGMMIVSADPPFMAISLNQIVYDPTSHCAYGKPNRILNQATRYLLLVTNGLHDISGKSVIDDGGYRACLKSSESYCEALETASDRVSREGSNQGIVSASLFTTMSATSWLESVHAAVNSYPGALLPAGNPEGFDLSTLKSVVWQPDNAGLGPQPLPLSALAHVGRVAFGLFLSPNYLNPGGPAAGTITGNSTMPVPIPGLPSGMVPVSFHVFLPVGTPPRGGWPVVIYGHGLGDNQFGAPTYIASTLASWGFATLAIEITGHGFGPNGTVHVTDLSGNVTTEATPGRGIQLAPGALIGSQDGCIVPGPLAIRDCGRQTAVDLFAMVKTIRQTEGLGLGLNDDRIFYVGQSFGSIYGSLFHAVEPYVAAAVINAGGGTFTDIARLAVTGRPLGGAFLASQNLLNVPPASAAPYFQSCTAYCFNDEYPFRDQPAILNNVPGAIGIQAAFEATEWLGMLGDPLAFAPHFKTAPLPGVPPKRTLFQFGLGDLEVPNPTESALIRAADAKNTTWYFRFDRAWHMHPDLLTLENPPAAPYPILPHRILSNPTIFTTPSETPISLAEQKQVAGFFALNGWDLIDPNFLLPFQYFGQGIFERPSVLPEALQFQQIAPN